MQRKRLDKRQNGHEYNGYEIDSGCDKLQIYY
jgi:hypothetical protein